jgi:hypothetical protein
MTVVHRTLTRGQVENRKEKAVQFVRDVLGDPERADEIDDESIEAYAERRKIKMVGDPHGADMATKEELADRIRELEEENDELQDQLDNIADIAAPIEDEEGGEYEKRARPTVSNPHRRSLTAGRDTGRTRRNAGR